MVCGVAVLEICDMDAQIAVVLTPVHAGDGAVKVGLRVQMGKIDGRFQS